MKLLWSFSMVEIVH